MKNNKNTFSLNIHKKNPKKDANKYRLETVQDIFDIVNEKNISRFIRDFKNGLKIGIAMRKLHNSSSIKEGSKIKMSAFTWIED